MQFETYPFEKLAKLFEGIEVNPSYTPMSLTIGEPQFETPGMIRKELCESADLLNRYPKTAGEDYLKEAMLLYLWKRFGLGMEKDQIIPSFGSRELLFNFPQFWLYGRRDPVMAFPNPFYQIYEGAGIASGAKIYHLNLTKENNFLCSLTPQQMQQTDLVILNYPNNPTSATICKDELKWWVTQALRYDFVLLNDECYSEIYFDDTHKPISLLEASVEVGNSSFKNILVINSISKRSSAPGLRCGFIAGDRDILKEYMKYRTYVGCALPLPLQKTAAIAWSEESHVEYFRDIYKQNFQIAKEILDINIPDATFYIWLEVKDAINFTKKLYERYNVKILPGEFLARDDAKGMNPGKNYVRIALVEDKIKTKDALMRVKECLSEQ